MNFAHDSRCTTYDAHNRLVALEKNIPGTGTYEYAYDYRSCAAFFSLGKRMVLPCHRARRRHARARLMVDFIAGMLTVWYALVAGSLAFVIYDLATNTPVKPVMGLAWVLIMIYSGPIGLFIYLLSCRQPLPGTHDAFIRPHWKQAVGSLMHCVAGDATGIILAAAVVYRFSLPNGLDLIVEYAAAFVIGLLVFQALFMKDMFGSYGTAVRKTFFAEFVSMNMVMVGMIPAMLLLMHGLPGADNPWRPVFWGVMSAATMAGALTAYPINSWLVRHGLKHGMMSAEPRERPLSGAVPAHDGPSHPAGHAMAAAEHAHHGGMDGGHGESHAHAMAGVSAATQAAVALATLAALGAAIALTALVVPIRFS